MPNKSPQPPNRSGSRVGAGCMVLFALPFAAFGGFMAWKLTSEVYLSVASAGWVETPAELISVELRESGGDGGSQEVLAEYTYSRNGREYTSDRVGVHTDADNFSSYHEEKYDELRAAKEAGEWVACYVDPDDPTNALLDRALRPMILVFEGMFALVFGGVGSGLLFGGWYAARHGSREDKNAKAAPDQPWLWREEWKSGLLKSTDKAGMISISVFACFWNAISMPIAAVFLFSDKEKEWWAVPLVMLFPTIGVGLIAWAVYLAVRWARYGESTLRLATMPGVVGGRLAGVVIAPSGVQPREGFKATLTCTETITSGDNDRTNALWQDERVVKETLADHEPGRLGVPIVFTIPSDAQPTSEEQRVKWTLKLDAKIPGIDYQASFDVPVFRTADSRDGVTVDDQPLSEYERVESLDTLLAAEGILVEETGAIDGVRYTCPPGRNRASAIGVTLFMLVWNAIVAGMFVGGVGWFAWIFAAFGLLMVWASLDAWLACGELLIVGDHWRARNGWAGMRGAGREIAVGEIVAIDSRQSMSSSSQEGVKQWNHLVAELTDGSEVVLVRQVRSRQAERALLEALRNRAGLDNPETGPESPWDSLGAAPAE